MDSKMVTHRPLSMINISTDFRLSRYHTLYRLELQLSVGNSQCVPFKLKVICLGIENYKCVWMVW